MEELNVNVGDKVIIYRYNTPRVNRSFGNVIKISPTGQITVEENGWKIRFNKYGNAIGYRRGAPSIKKWSKEEEQEILQEAIIEKAMDVINELKTLTYEQAMDILRIFVE